MKYKIQPYSVFSIIAATLFFLISATNVNATPAFAKQMSMNCMACHSQSVPMLNSFGRTFKALSYTMVGGQKSMIEGGSLGMSMPAVLNVGVGIKAATGSSTKPGTRDTIGIPTGTTIMIGGKAAKNVGVHTMWNGDGLVHNQISFSKPVGSGQAGFVLAGSKGHGAFIGTESYNTGLHRELQMFDNAARTNAAQAVGFGLAKGSVTSAVAFYRALGLNLSAGFQTLGYNLNFSNGSLDTGGTGGYVLRATYDLPTVAGWGIMVGGFSVDSTTTGTTTSLIENADSAILAALTKKGISTSAVNEHAISSSGFDMQAQGVLFGLDTQILFTHVADYKMAITEISTGKSINADNGATSLQMETMLSPALGVKAAVMSYTDNIPTQGPYVSQSFSSTSVGVNYNYTDNIRVSAELSSIDMGTGTDFVETLLTGIIAF